VRGTASVTTIHCNDGTASPNVVQDELAILDAELRRLTERLLRLPCPG
jgi:hypothetical protein